MITQFQVQANGFRVNFTPPRQRSSFHNLHRMRLYHACQPLWPKAQASAIQATRQLEICMSRARQRVCKKQNQLLVSTHQSHWAAGKEASLSVGSHLRLADALASWNGGGCRDRLRNSASRVRQIRRQACETHERKHGRPSGPNLRELSLIGTLTTTEAMHSIAARQATRVMFLNACFCLQINRRSDDEAVLLKARLAVVPTQVF
jgi:hypothetical protein